VVVGVGGGVDGGGVGGGVVGGGVGTTSGWHDLLLVAGAAIMAARWPVWPACAATADPAAATLSPVAAASSTPPAATLSVMGRACAKRMNRPYQC
jgi:hypothetical protein